MSFIHDFIMESHDLEDAELFKILTVDTPKPPEPKPIKTELEEGCGDEKKSSVQEEVINESGVDIEKYLDTENYVESLQINEKVTDLPDRYQKGRDGSPEFESNNKRLKREATYRKYANIDNDFEITEDNINKWALNRTCMEFRCDPDKLTAELLHQPVTGLEKY